MKRAILCLIVATGVGALRTHLHSQEATPVAVASLPPIAAIPNGPPLEMLKAIRDANAKLLDQQAATLLKLDEMEKASQALKALGKRS